ncbi:PilZ domain-containing protein [Sphingomonas suaedae]|uniref:PilZ domain-containing protein n=1 Tax=Sphingomonas suaedae TaxID=2599297 RepID=UPI0016495D54|nr:PilZ domain-containing protein [Sphingomonas suaedae]
MPVGKPEESSRARLIGGEAGERDCFVHRLTSEGAMLSVNGPVAHGDRATIELPFGLAVEGAIVGDDPAALAFRFDAPMDVVGALARCLAALPAERRQMPRIELRQRLCIRHAGQVDFAWTRNLSPAGLGVETRTQLHVGEAVELTLDGLRPIQGEIRWTEQGQAGIAFFEEIGWQVLMPWLRQVADRRPPATRDSYTSPSPLGAVKNALKLEVASHVRSGSSWWNAQVLSLSNALVEFESDTEFAPLSGLWLSLPEIGGWPIRVIECHGTRHVAEFRLPLRPHEMARLSEVARPR